MDKMISQLPYFIRAIYEWIIDNNMTPYIMINAIDDEHLIAPMEYIEDGRLVLSISPSAVRDLEMGNDFIFFSGSFNGAIKHIQIPVDLVLTIYAKELGPTMFFSEPEFEDEDGPTTDNTPPIPPQKPKGKPFLKIVK